MFNRKLLGMLVSFFIILFALVPRTFNYQGKLLDSDGVGINDTLDITFRLYTYAEGGTHLWETTLTDVEISLGLFSVELFGIPDTIDFSNQYYLEIEIETETLSPREKLTSTPYSIRSEYVDNAIQSVMSEEDRSGRIGNVMFRAGDGAILSDSGDTIVIEIGGGTSSGIVADKPLVGDGTTSSHLIIDYDDITIGKNLVTDKLIVKDDGITNIQIMNGTILREDLSSDLLTDFDNAETLEGYNASDFAPSSSSSNYIQNQTDSVQSGSFNIDGNAYIGGNIGIGTETPSMQLEVQGDIKNSGECRFSDNGLRIVKIDTIQYLQLPSSGGNIRFSNWASSTSLLEITSSGNVGIGTNTPSVRLEVNGDIKGLVTELKMGDSFIYHQVVAEAWCLNIAKDQGVAEYMFGVQYSPPGSPTCGQKCQEAGWTGAMGRLEWKDDSVSGGTTLNNVKWRQGSVSRTNAAMCCCYH